MTGCMCGGVAPLCEHCRRERRDIIGERLTWIADATTWSQRERKHR
jgi:hypothetical protein